MKDSGKFLISWHKSDGNYGPPNVAAKGNLVAMVRQYHRSWKLLSPSRDIAAHFAYASWISHSVVVNAANENWIRVTGIIISLESLFLTYGK